MNYPRSCLIKEKRKRKKEKKREKKQRKGKKGRFGLFKSAVRPVALLHVGSTPPGVGGAPAKAGRMLDRAV